MTKSNEEKEIIFKKCPICKKGDVTKTTSKSFFGLLSSNDIVCSNCKAKFKEANQKEQERVFKLNLSDSNIKNPYDGQALKVSEWERGISDLDLCIQTNTLPQAEVVGLKIILNRDEQSHWFSGTLLMEERAVRQSTGGAIRIMKGVYVGSSRSESHGELRKIDSGTLLLTDKRLIFNGNMRNLEYPLNKIISVEEYKDAIEIGSSNRQKVQLFAVDEPHKWAVFVNIAVKKSQGSGRIK